MPYSQQPPSHSLRLPKDACLSAFHLLQPITPGSTRSLGQRHFSRCTSNVGLCSSAGTSRTPKEGTANTFLQQTMIVVGDFSKYQHSPEKYRSPPRGSAQQGWMAQQPTFRCTAEIDPPQSFFSVYPPLSSMFCMRIDCTGYLTDVYCTSFTFGSQKAQTLLPGGHTTLAGMETPCPQSSSSQGCRLQKAALHFWVAIKTDPRVLLYAPSPKLTFRISHKECDFTLLWLNRRNATGTVRTATIITESTARFQTAVLYLTLKATQLKKKSGTGTYAHLWSWEFNHWENKWKIWWSLLYSKKQFQLQNGIINYLTFSGLKLQACIF